MGGLPGRPFARPGTSDRRRYACGQSKPTGLREATIHTAPRIPDDPPTPPPVDDADTSDVRTVTDAAGKVYVITRRIDVTAGDMARAIAGRDDTDVAQVADTVTGQPITIIRPRPLQTLTAAPVVAPVTRPHAATPRPREARRTRRTRTATRGSPSGDDPPDEPPADVAAGAAA
jgi:hypothetical protein